MACEMTEDKKTTVIWDEPVLFDGMPDTLENQVDKAPEAGMVSDETLMTQIARGDRVAFQSLVDRHLGRCLVIIRGFHGLETDAEDIAQEAFTKVWVKAPKWTPPDAKADRAARQASGQAGFRTWFHRLLVNHCIDRQRRLGDGQKRRAVGLDQAPDVADETPVPEEQLLAKERDQQVAKAVASLPERQRMALTLCAFEGHSNRDAADIMGVGVKALEALLVRGRRELREKLEHVMAGYGG